MPPSLIRLQWAERTNGEDAGFPILFNAFQSTTRHGRLTSIKASLAGRLVYLRFKCTTGGRNARVGVILKRVKYWRFVLGERGGSDGIAQVGAKVGWGPS